MVMGHRTLPELKKFAKMIRSHQALIFNCFCAKKEFSSGIIEGFNNKAKLTIRKSCGFRNDKLREIALLYHTLGNLSVSELLSTDSSEEAIFLYQTFQPLANRS